jgi:DNA repair protein RadC
MAPVIEAPAGVRNYRLNVVTFSVVREPEAPAPRKLTGPAEVAALAREIIPDDAREHFVALYLNAQNGLVAVHEVSVGTLNASLVHPREVFGPALRLLGVASIILIHNHPSSDPTPSREDIRLTRQLVEAAHLLDMHIHDHVIIGNGTASFVSLAERGVI